MNIKWDKSNDLSREQARTKVENLIKIGWWYELEYALECGNNKHLPPKPSFYKKHSEIELIDTVDMIYRSEDLCSVMEFLHGIGLRPCLTSVIVSDKKKFNVLVDIEGSIYASHTYATRAALNALKAWDKAGRPLPPHNNTVVVYEIVPLQKRIEEVLEQNDGLCMDVKAERRKLAKTLAKALRS
jgi:hypothetical protein